MFLKGKRYIYIGFIASTHGKKGKVIFRMRRYISPERIPPRIFIKKKDRELEEFRVKLIKPYKKSSFILKLNKIRGETEAKGIVSSDVYIAEEDLPRKSRIELGIIPEFIPEVKPEDEDSLDEVGVITKPRGLQGAVAVVVPKEKAELLLKAEGREIIIKSGDRFFKTSVRSAKKVREMQDNVYLSLKLLHINDVNSAERLRKSKIYVSTKVNEKEEEEGERGKK